MIIKILGTGCPSCIKLEKNVITAISNSGKDITIEKVTKISEIMDYGVMMTPSLVIDEKVVSVGKILSVSKLEKLIK